MLQIFTSIRPLVQQRVTNMNRRTLYALFVEGFPMFLNMQYTKISKDQ